MFDGSAWPKGNGAGKRKGVEKNSFKRGVSRIESSKTDRFPKASLTPREAIGGKR